MKKHILILFLTIGCDGGIYRIEEYPPLQIGKCYVSTISSYNSIFKILDIDIQKNKVGNIRHSIIYETFSNGNSVEATSWYNFKVNNVKNINCKIIENYR